VADALSRKQVDVVLVDLKLADLVKEGVVRRYWLEDDLLYAKGHRLYVSAGPIRRELLRESHDSQ